MTSVLTKTNYCIVYFAVTKTVPPKPKCLILKHGNVVVFNAEISLESTMSFIAAHSPNFLNIICSITRII